MPQTGKEVRSGVSQQLITGPTSGMAPGFVQANLAILPVDWAFDFLLFAQRNPKPCPIIEAGDMGNPFTKFCADGADIRTDIPKYRVYKHGEMTEERLDIKDLWQDDFVYFLLGCSFSFEDALIKAGLKIRHMEENVNVPMYKTSIMCHAAGKFQETPMVVSMRPFKPADAIKAIEITREFPTVHGSPVHIGNPEEIGIADISRPDFGDPVTIKEGEVPVFWACGVTPQMAAMVARPPLMITHAPGHMFVGDKMDHEFKL
ncbi:UPF0317 protein YcsI [Desulfoluna limicola]|uniref:UPF0317 protein YcsI n=1 Tax=Desulfoluna limicola TaxID=2810562 RepID=A0ABN6F2Z1_9BACT|nr:putative hydro-lyase [Desulfoluna limicola]BCS95986.1 UPF0317 protein YcsI [Desulfoluna limicola]